MFGRLATFLAVISHGRSRGYGRARKGDVVCVTLRVSGTSVFFGSRYGNILATEWFRDIAQLTNKILRACQLSRRMRLFHLENFRLIWASS